MEKQQYKKRKFTLTEVDSLFGKFQDGNYVQTVRLVRQDIKEFKMGVQEAAKTCQMNHVSPYDVFIHSREMADQVINEVLRARFLRNVRAAERTK